MEKISKERVVFELNQCNKSHKNRGYLWISGGGCEKTMSKDGKDGKDDVSGVGIGLMGGALWLDFQE
jgi:hypothetical protein